MFWSNSPVVNIGTKSVGSGNDVYIIAEAGVNHNGKFDIALRLVESAKRVGADAVKFQVFTADNLVVDNAPTADYQGKKGYKSQKEMLRELELTRQEFTDLFYYCRDVGIEFLATPFSIDDLEFLLDLGVNVLKIASPYLVNLPLIERAIESGLPIIASTGTCTEEEVDYAVELFTSAGALGRLVLLHCVSSYPTLLEDANLSVISTFVHRYPVPIGYSDHTPEEFTGALAVCCGATVLEKHFTINNSLPGPDQELSLNEQEMKVYIELARKAQKALGYPIKRVLECEEEVRRVSRGSVVAKVDIPAGTVITSDMLTVKRPGTGIEPLRIKEVIGCRASVDIKADTLIQWTMLELFSPSQKKSANVREGQQV